MFEPAADSDIPEGGCADTWFMTCSKPQLCLPCNSLLSCCRKLVSRSKTRYQEDGFDLDMAYTSPDEKRVLTLGFPAAGLEHLYRNPRLEVRRYLEQHHSNHFKIFNLCCEPGRNYDSELFQNRVERWPFRDHCIPPLETMLGLSNSAKQWIDEDPKNMLAIHCKAGKGRAGIMTCVVLLRLGYFDTADEAMDHYDAVRVLNNRGLTVQSQRRSVRRFEMLWRNVWKVEGSLSDVAAESDLRVSGRQLPDQPTRRIKNIRLLNIGGGVTVSRNLSCKVRPFPVSVPASVSVSSMYMHSSADGWDASCPLSTYGKQQEDLRSSSAVHLSITRIDDQLIASFFLVQVFRGGSFDPVLLAEARLSPYSSEGAKEWKLDVDVKGNFLVQIFDVHFLLPTCEVKAPVLAKRCKFCEAWENTAFVEDNTLAFQRDELDMKKKLRKRVSPEMELLIAFYSGEEGALDMAGAATQL
jgi:hypothetical protein